METAEILDRINQAIQNVTQNQLGVLTRGLNERIISGHLADALRPLFPDYDVDPEYNGDIDKPNDRKALDIAKNRIIGVGHNPNNRNNYKLSPDIIIHKQGTNDDNLVVLEVKKDSGPQDKKNFDHIKLEHLTIDYTHNHYNYKLGVAIIFGTLQNAGQREILFFQQGISTDDVANLN